MWCYIIVYCIAWACGVIYYSVQYKIIDLSKKLFWKEIKRVRKGEQERDEMVKDINAQILRDGVEVRRRWAEYFEQVLNVADVREANINVVGNWQMPVFRFE